MLDALDAFYLGAFLFGLLFSAVSHLLGFAHAHAPGHGLKVGKVGKGHAGHHAAPTPAHAADKRIGIGPLNPLSILAFISWFGGVGYEARHALGIVAPVSILFGLVGGLIGAVIVWWFLVKVILPNDRALDPEDYRLPGTAARVSSPIRAGGTGEVVYEQGGVRQVSAARSLAGWALPRGSEVVIRSCERGTVLVEPSPAIDVDRPTGLAVATALGRHPTGPPLRILPNGLVAPARAISSPRTDGSRPERKQAMFAVNDALDAVLLGCFFFGLLFTVVVFFVGDAGIGAEGSGADAAGDGDALLPLNLSTLVAFLTWFGGVGYLIRQAVGWPALVSLVVGVAGGLIGAVAVGWVMAKLVSAKDGELHAEDYRLPGTIARVTSPIRAGGTGEIVYEQGGVRQVAAARAADGRSLPRGAEVVVLDRVRGIVTVEPAAVFFGEEPAARPVSGEPPPTHPIEAG